MGGGGQWWRQSGRVHIPDYLCARLSPIQQCTLCTFLHFSALFALFCTFFCTAPKNSDILMTGSGSKGTFVSCTHLVSRTDVENTQMLKNAT